jgi:hypothetical protein
MPVAAQFMLCRRLSFRHGLAFAGGSRQWYTGARGSSLARAYYHHTRGACGNAIHPEPKIDLVGQKVDKVVLTDFRRKFLGQPAHGWAPLRRQAAGANHQRVCRLWQQHGFSMRIRRRRQRGDLPSPSPYTYHLRRTRHRLLPGAQIVAGLLLR